MTKILLIGMTLVVTLGVLAIAAALVRLMLNFMVSLTVSLGLSVLTGLLVALSLGLSDIQNSTVFGALAAMAVFIPTLFVVHRFRHGNRASRASPSIYSQEAVRQQPATIPPQGETAEMSDAWNRAIEMAPNDAAVLDRARHACAAVLLQTESGVLDIELIDMAALLRNHLAPLDLYRFRAGHLRV